MEDFEKEVSNFANLSNKSTKAFKSIAKQTKTGNTVDFKLLVNHVYYFYSQESLEVPQR